ncbi:class I SAM-dependent methyltransferase [Vreelandella boliviensis]|uniref:class I SAM-dependent methyltransferase n=1 Tax=Vreelandella boliviensis TaxID=223527 RepID=UPI001B8CF508|nr:phospholipid methyltransferase [Halomonas boliviensis]MBS3666390.1 phospholipid methyltransferase [Halomonas boliviensis]
MKQCTATNELLSFFLAWARNPLLVASVIPSGSALAGLITSEISHETGPVIELGPGNGVFTRALIERGVKQEDLTLIESMPEFAVALSILYPQAQILRMDATRLRMVDLFDGKLAGAVISGLPLLSMSPRKVVAVLSGAFRKMGPEGVFYQFTYGARCPVSQRIQHHLGIKAELLGRTLANFPPATVYRFHRISSMH